MKQENWDKKIILHNGDKTFEGQICTRTDENGNRILNDRVPIEYLDEVISVVEKCSEMISKTKYYQAAYCKELQGVDPVCLAEFNLSSLAYILKYLKNPF